MNHDPPHAQPTPSPFVWAIIPTYNERHNIRPLTQELLGVQPGLHVVVVDDGSPDGTGEVVDELAGEFEQVHLLQRGERGGYSSAVQAGMRLALDSGAELLLQMDADFSHHPRYVPTLVALATRDCDVAIGSRYAPGGCTRNWGTHRKLLSLGANFLARSLLRLPARDCTGGFRCYRREVVEQSGVLAWRTEGYAFLLTTLYSLGQQGWRVRETPIVFVDREFGKSKLSKRIIAESALVTARLALRRLEAPPRPHASYRSANT